jgi:transcription antitermination protein NusB
MMADTERPSVSRSKKESRHRAREAALQMLYQWEVGRTPIDDVCRTFWAERGEAPAETMRQFAISLAGGVATETDALDALIVEAAEHWRLERMNVLDRLILRLAVHEFLHQPDTPGPVVITEALALARTYSADESVAFINGVLDAIRRTLGRA